MRVTEGTGQQQFLTAINSLESGISQTQDEISSNESFTTASGESSRRRRGQHLQPGSGTEPAVLHQRQQRPDQSEHREQRPDPGHQSAAEPARSGAGGKLRDARAERSVRDCLANPADPRQPALARQHPKWQRRLHLQRLRDTDAAVCADRHRGNLQRRSRYPAGTDCRRPDACHRRQR
jgi:hypothetical protein